MSRHNQASVAPDGWAPIVAISCGDDVSSLGGGWRRVGRHGLGSVLGERERRDDDIRQAAREICDHEMNRA